MDDIKNMCAGLRLSGREGSRVDLSPPKKEIGFVLAGKFCTNRRVNLESVVKIRFCSSFRRRTWTEFSCSVPSPLTNTS